MPKRMNDAELMAVLQQEYSSGNLYSNVISSERQDALNLYEMRDLGNEVDGRSKVKTSDVADVIDWMMPQMQEMLAAGDIPVEFVPTKEDDVDQAKQETQYVWHVINQQNDGFLMSYVWHKDALLQKNGVIKVFWDESVEPEREDYQQLSPEEFEMLGMDEGLSIKKVEREITERVVFDAISGQEIVQPSESISVEAFRDKEKSQVRIINIAPENFLVRRGWHSVCLDGVPYCAHREYMAISELRAEGVPERVLSKLGDGDDSDSLTGERENRYLDEDGGFINDFGAGARKSTWVTEHYIMVDYNGDGIDELRKIRTAGNVGSMTMIDNVEVDYNPFVVITPDIMPHRFWGRAVADGIAEIQRIKTVLLRQMMDNIYLSNNPRPVVQKGMVDLDSLFDNRIGAPIYENAPGAVRFDAVPFAAAASLPLMEYVDKLREERSGVSQQTQGLDPDSLKQHTLFASSQLMNAARQRILLIARIFAEVGYKSLFRKVHELVCKNEKNAKIFEVTGSYVSVNPATWRKRDSLRVLVGTGNHQRPERLAAVTQVLQYQEKMVAAQGGVIGMVNLENIHNALSEFCSLSGIVGVSKYFTPPNDVQYPPPQPPQPDPATQVAMADVQMRGQQAAVKAQFEAAKSEEELAFKREQEATKSLLERERLAMEERVRMADIAAKSEIEEAKLEMDAMRLQVQLLGKQEGEGAEAKSDKDETVALSIAALSKQISSIEEKLKKKKEHSFEYDKSGKIVGAETVTVV